MKQRIVVFFLIPVLLLTSTYASTTLSRWKDRVEHKDDGSVVIQPDKPPAYEVYAQAAGTAALAGLTGWLAYRTFKRGRFFSISLEGIHFPKEPEVVPWQTIDPKVKLTRVWVRDAYRPGFSLFGDQWLVRAVFSVNEPASEKVIAISDAALDFDTLNKVAEYYRNDRSKSGFVDLKKFENRQLRITKKEAIIYYAALHWYPLTLSALFTAAVSVLTIATAKKKFGSQPPLITIKHDGIILHPKDDLRLPVKGVKYRLQYAPVHRIRQLGYLVVQQDRDEYRIPVSMSFKYGKFEELVKNVQSPIVQIMRFENETIYLEDGQQIHASDINHIEQGRRDRAFVQRGDLWGEWIFIVKNDGSRVCIHNRWLSQPMREWLGRFPQEKFEG